MGLAIGILAAGAALALGQPDTPAAQEPQGPPTISPLARQSGSGAAGPAGATPSIVAPPAHGVAPPANTTTATATNGLVSYPASFFAAAQPNTAREMIARVPGFTFDDGATARGFDAAAGNVLIDGELPASKSDDIDSVLRRLPASQVLRIDVIRGGAPGIDMHGKSLVANVIRKSGSSTSGDIQLTERWVTSDGRQQPGIRIEGSSQHDGTSLEGSFAISRFIDDGQGHGSVVQTGPGGAGVAQDDTKGGGYEAVATGAYAMPLAGGTFRVNFSLQYQPYFDDETVGDEAAAIPTSIEHDHQNTEQSELGLHYTRDFGSKLSLETLAIQQLDGEDSLTLYSTPGEFDRFREQHTNGETIGRAVVTWRATPQVTVETGAETAYNWLHSHTHYDENEADVVIPAADVDVTELRGEAFAKGDLDALAQAERGGGPARGGLPHRLDRRRGAGQDAGIPKAAPGGRLVANAGGPDPHPPGAGGQPARLQRFRGGFVAVDGPDPRRKPQPDAAAGLGRRSRLPSGGSSRTGWPRSRSATPRSAT